MSILADVAWSELVLGCLEDDVVGGTEVELLQLALDDWEGWPLDGSNLPAPLQQEVAGQEKNILVTFADIESVT